MDAQAIRPIGQIKIAARSHDAIGSTAAVEVANVNQSELRERECRVEQ